MKYLWPILLVVAACEPPPKPAEITRIEVKCAQDMSVEYESCRAECNPYIGQWLNCPDWVREKWTYGCDLIDYD